MLLPVCESNLFWDITASGASTGHMLGPTNNTFKHIVQ